MFNLTEAQQVDFKAYNEVISDVDIIQSSNKNLSEASVIAIVLNRRIENAITGLTAALKARK